MFISSLSRSKGNTAVHHHSLWLVSRPLVTPDPAVEMDWLIALNNSRNNVWVLTMLCVLLQRLFNYLKILWSILSGVTIIIPILSMLKWKNRDINFARVKQVVMVDLGFEPVLSLHCVLKGDWAGEPLCLESTFRVTLWEKCHPCHIRIWILALLYYVARDKVFNQFSSL